MDNVSINDFVETKIYSVLTVGDCPFSDMKEIPWDIQQTISRAFICFENSL